MRLNLLKFRPNLRNLCTKKSDQIAVGIALCANTEKLAFTQTVEQSGNDQIHFVLKKELKNLFEIAGNGKHTSQRRVPSWSVKVETKAMK